MNLRRRRADKVRNSLNKKFEPSMKNAIFMSPAVISSTMGRDNVFPWCDKEMPIVGQIINLHLKAFLLNNCQIRHWKFKNIWDWTVLQKNKNRDPIKAWLIKVRFLLRSLHSWQLYACRGIHFTNKRLVRSQLSENVKIVLVKIKIFAVLHIWKIENPV